MQGRTTIQLGVIAVILGSGLYLLDEHLERRQSGQVQVQRVFDVTTDPVTAVSFEKAGERIEFVRKDEMWFLQAPVRARANEPLVERMVSILEKMRWEEYITREDREQRGLSFPDYGLKPSAWRIVLETGGGRVQRLHVGDRAPFGGTVYGRMSRGDNVFSLPEGILNLYPENLADWRDRTLVYGNPEKTERIDLFRRDAGFVQLVRQKGEWVLQQPLAARADHAAVRRLLDAVFALQVATFHWDADASAGGDDEGVALMEKALKAQIEAGGLAADDARLKVTVWTEGDRLGQELLFGREADAAIGGVFARKVGVDAVYTVPAAILEACAVPVDALRDRAVFHYKTAEVGVVSLQHGENRLELQRLPNDAGWQMLTPVRAAADTEAVDTLISRLLGLKVSAYLPKEQAGGEWLVATDNKPLMRIALAPAILDSGMASTGGVSAVATGKDVLLLGGASAERSQRLAINPVRDEPFTLDAEATQGFDETLVTPLRFRSRVMLEVNTATVCRVQITLPSGTQRVERVDEPLPVRWRCAEEPVQQADSAAVADLLAAAERIEASRLVAFMPPDLAVYGLAAPVATSVTFGFRGEGAIQNTLLLGIAADDAWRYAMVQGHDFVFLLPAAMAARLLQPVCQPSPPASPPAAAVKEGSALPVPRREGD